MSEKAICMSRNHFPQRPNFRQIARDLNISATTLYRVLNRRSNVRESTRQRILKELNEKGVFLYPTQKTTVVFDFGPCRFLNRFIPPLRKRLSEDFECVETDSSQDREQFLNAESSAEVVLFLSDQTQEIADAARAINPNILTIGVFPRAELDVQIRFNDARSCALAARYLYDMGHRHILLHRREKHIDGVARTNFFLAAMLGINPKVQVDILEIPGDVYDEYIWEEYMSRTPEENLPTALFFVAHAGYAAFENRMLSRFPDRYGRFSALALGDPRDLAWPDYPIHVDHIGGRVQELLEWVDFFVRNRPILRDQKPIELQISTTLVREGTVRKMTHL